MNDTCRICAAPLTIPATGRPPRYCGEPCRRVGEYTIKRADRRIERLERLLDDTSPRLPSSTRTTGSTATPYIAPIP